MSISRERIEVLLEKIQDPDLKKGLVSAKLVQEIIINEDQIKIIVSISNPALHARKRMHDAVIFNLEREPNWIILELIRHFAHKFDPHQTKFLFVVVAIKFFICRN